MFLDSRLAHITASGWPLVLAIVLMASGFLFVLGSMPILGRRSFGKDTGALYSGGLYRYGRNPQLVGGFLFIASYALLWPSWNGVWFAFIWLPLAYMMIKAEEEHLRNVFRKAYGKYCQRAPRLFGWPRR